MRTGQRAYQETTHIISVARINSSPFATAVRTIEMSSELTRDDNISQTHAADLRRRSECSLNLRISGSAPRCFPACIVISLSFPVYKNIVKLTHVWKGSWKVKFRTSSWSSRVASRSMNISTSSSRSFLGSSSSGNIMSAGPATTEQEKLTIIRSF